MVKRVDYMQSLRNWNIHFCLQNDAFSMWNLPVSILQSVQFRVVVMYIELDKNITFWCYVSYDQHKANSTIWLTSYFYEYQICKQKKQPFPSCNTTFSWLLNYDWDLLHWQMCHICLQCLTHWGREKMDAISQTTFSSAFSWMKMFEFRLKFHWSLFPRVQLTNFQQWFR